MTARDANEPTKARRQDVWRSNNTCMICQDFCKTREEKDKHEQQMKHKKKLVIYEFFATEVPKFQPFSGSSVLVKRYTACGEQYVGLECLHELHFSFASEPWWACSICYESGALLEQADMHLSSMNHITTYLDEFHSHKMLNLNINGDPLKVYEHVKRVCKEVLEEEEGECTPPECIVMDASITKTDAMAKLAIDPNRCKPSYIVHTDCTSQSKQARKILQCSTCHQLIACDSDLLDRIWKVHELSPSHRQAVAIMMVLEQFDVTFESGYDEVKPTRPFKWKIVDDVYHGPMCGIEYLIVFNKGSFCELCGCAVKSVEDHFTCESHIMQFLTITFPTEMFRISQYAPDSRRTAVLGLTASPKFRFGGGLHKKVNVDWFPPSMEMMMKPEVPSFPSLMPELSPLGIDCQCLFCPICWRVVSVPKHVYDGGKALWSTHCAEQSHFEFAIKRACFGFGTSIIYFILHYSEGKETLFYVQTQGDVGLEFVVDDLENEEVVCILCAQWFARGMQTLINNHIRSYKHLIHYLHVTNRNLLSMLRVQKTEEASRELVLEWLQRSLYNDLDEMRLYSPEAAQRMRRWGNITIRKVGGALVILSAEKAEVSIKEALAVAAVKVHSLKKKNGKVERVLCRCTEVSIAPKSTRKNRDCSQNLASCFILLLMSAPPVEKSAVVAIRRDMLGFTEEKSTYTVKPFVQPDPTRKVSWQWNAKEKTHEFVLSVIGLEDLVERRSSETLGAHPPDFFCRLCAVVIPRRSAALEAHVHSAQHVLCYVHKYHPQTIMELDILPKEGGKEMRRIIAQLLKDHQLKEPYCIPIYDPVGEQERKGIVALQTAQERERQRVLAEARKQAQEQRKKMDEERRKQRELQAERERVKQAERAQRERELKERSERLQREKLRAQKRLDEAKRKVEEERKAQEEKEAEGAERKRRQDELRALLDQEKQRLKAMQEKEAAQRRLMEEKDKLERKMQELKERAHQSPHTHRLASPHMAAPAVGVVNAPQLRSYREPMGMVPPNALPYSVSPSPFDAPASVRETLENIGPKPMFPEFVPVANKVPVYRGMEEADRAIRLISPEPRPEVVNRPSLRDRKVDPYIANSNIIQTREQLVDFLWRQGAERIPAKELPAMFNEKATCIEGALGVDCLYEMEKPPGVVSNRLRSLLDRATIERIWPEHVDVLDQSWKTDGSTMERVDVPPPVSKSAMMFPEDQSSTVIKREPKDDSASNGVKHSSRSKDKDKDKSGKSDSRSSTAKDKEEDSGSKVLTQESVRHPLKLSFRLRQEKWEDICQRRQIGNVAEAEARREVAVAMLDTVTVVPAEKSFILLAILIAANLIVADLRVEIVVIGRQPVTLVVADVVEAAHRVILSRAAASVLDPSKDHRSTSSRARELEEKLEQLRQLAKSQPSAPVSMVVEELLEGSSSRRKAPVQLVEEVDEKAQMRKLLGVLITMQQEAERNGRVDESLVDRLYREVGLKKSVESTSDQLLAQLCSQISQETESRTRPSIDLQSFGIGLQNCSEAPQMQPSPSIFGGGFRPRAQTSQSTTFQTLLSDVKRSLDSFNRPTRSNSPLIKSPFVITNRDEVFPESETKSYVYPGADSQTFNQPSHQSERPSDSNLTKKEKAALRRKQLLEEAERLRKEAEEEDEEEDDWDCLVEVINQPAPTPTSSSADDRNASFGNSSGRSAKGKSQQQKSGGKKDVKQAGGRQGTSVPLVPGQKMPLARTILPNGQSAEDAKTKRREEEREREREKRNEKDKEGINEKDQGVGKRNVHGTPSSWPQPVPQPFLGASMSTSSSMHEQHQQQSQQQSNFQHPLHVPMMGNEPVYCNSSNAPVYPNTYVSYQSADPQQFPGPQFFHGQPSVMGPSQSQQFVPGFEFLQMQQQQFYGHPPYYG
ncbi:unnamed protein product [Haemonchus placei]|uniref:C2H2-type domain-containing protein n=1 Tax=Haemonchus placei TaxID=6290 RepID=A0A158QKD7_HAEPC|nr:unnamed protein product [Haemonchus placei]